MNSNTCLIGLDKDSFDENKIITHFLDTSYQLAPSASPTSANSSPNHQSPRSPVYRPTSSHTSHLQEYSAVFI